MIRETGQPPSRLGASSSGLIPSGSVSEPLVDVLAGDPVPSTASVRHRCAPVGDQFRDWTCTAFAVLGALECLAGVNLSEADAVDAYAKATGTNPRRDGMAIDMALEFLGQRGVLTERLWRYTETAPRPGWEKKPRYRPVTYTRVPCTPCAAKSTIALQRVPLVVTLFRLGDAWDTGRAEIPVPSQELIDAARDSHGELPNSLLHAVALVAYDEGRLLVRNSFGMGWGRSGYQWMAQGYLHALGSEAWRITTCETVMP